MIKFLIVFVVVSFISNETLLNAQLSDIEGNTYKTVKIGSQLWMAENLKTTMYNDGTPIPVVSDSSAWRKLKVPACCFYDNKMSNKNTYGVLYNWYTVKTNKLCPNGWHVPDELEWNLLTGYLGQFNIAGGKLKEKGTGHWKSPNTGATNEAGFTALPGGYRYGGGQFAGIGEIGHWWSSVETGTDIGWDFYLYFISEAMGDQMSVPKQYGASIRCIKNK